MNTHGDGFEIFVHAGAPCGGEMLQRSAGIGQVVNHMLRSSRGYGSTGPRPGRTYSQVAAVYACVREKSNALSGLPMTVSTLDDQIVETGPLVDLSQRPNAKMTGRTFWRNTSAFLDLFGRVHWVMTLDAGGRPVEVVPVSPLQMKPVVNRTTGELIGWKFRAAGALRGNETMIPPDEVHTIIDPDFEDVDNPFDGLSPRRAAMAAIAQYWKSDIANEASLDNGVEPGGVFTMQGNMGDGQRRDLRDQLNERHGGAANRRRFMVLEGGMDWKTTAASFTEMEFSELKKMSRVDICAAFNVPPPVCGFFEDSNYAHADAAEQAFYIRTVLPRAGWLAEEWSIGVLNRLSGDRSLAMADARRSSIGVLERSTHGYRVGRKAASKSRVMYFAWFDSSDVPAVQRAKLAQTEAAKSWIEKGVPLNQIIRAYDLPFEEVAWGDTWWRQIGLIDVQEDYTPGADDPTGAEPIEDAAGIRSGGAPGVMQRAGQDARRSRIWHQWRASWASLERATFTKLKGHFYALRTQTLANLERAMPAKGARAYSPVEQRDLIAEILFDIVKANETLMIKTGPLIREAYRLGGEQVMQEAADAEGKKDPSPFNIADPHVAEKMRKRQVRVTGANRTTRNKLAQSLAEGLGAGEGREQLAERVKAVFKQAEGSRARLIARQEVGSAVEESRSEARNQAGVPMKSWLWSRKEKGRSAHAATEQATMATPIPNDESFEIVGTGVRCDHPRSSGDPAQDINCGCTTISRYPGDSVKDVLDRYTKRGFLTYEQLSLRDHRTPGNPERNTVKDGPDESRAKIH